MAWLLPTRPQRALQIRRATTNDIAQIARVYVDSWRETYADLLPRSYLDGLSYATFEQHWRRTFMTRGWAFVAEVQSGIVGLASGGRSRQPDLAAGELYVLYVLRAHQRQGIGRALFDACHYELARRGHGSMLVWVMAANPARGFYEHVGGELTSENELEIAGAKVREVAYVWPE